MRLWVDHDVTGDDLRVAGRPPSPWPLLADIFVMTSLLAAALALESPVARVVVVGLCVGCAWECALPSAERFAWEWAAHRRAARKVSRAAARMGRQIRTTG